jgi:hypothetical protein
MTTLPLRARLALLRLAEQEALQDAYRADIAARGVVAVVAPFIPEQRRAS